MKKETKTMILIYTLLVVILVILIVFTSIILSNPKKKSQENSGSVQKVDVERYPPVNNECTFDVKLSEYQSLTQAGCKNGYTRYNINDITVDEIQIKVSVIYSDKERKKTGLYINDTRVSNNIDSITYFKFGIFDSKLFVLDINNSESNVMVFNTKGEKIYDLSNILSKEKIKDLSTGDTVIKTSDLDPASFSFNEGAFEFSSKLDKCQTGTNSNGSHYKVTYKKDKFEKPEFISLVSC